MNFEAFFKMTYGLYLISSKFQDKLNGFIANSVFQVTAEPPQIAISANKNNFTTELIKKSRSYTISVLQQDTDIEFIAEFGYKTGRDFDKFSNLNFKYGDTGVPIVIDNAVAFFECKLKQEVDLGTHILFISEVINCDIIDNTKIPITYTYYREEKKAFAPENAPTYIDKKKLKISEESDGKMSERYKCSVCGYIYDPAAGDDIGGIAPGTPFEDLPENWVCPVCGAAKEEFEKQ
jgi:flavin reductase (DIM6/NTAB) family NADH-FMN oxidoreductase RutF/rubredoxin